MIRSRTLWLCVLIVVASLLLLWMVAGFTPSPKSADQDESCVPAGSSVEALPAFSLEGVSAEYVPVPLTKPGPNPSIVAIAFEVLAEARASDRVRLATFQAALTESDFRNLANDTVPSSQKLPKDGSGRDHDSVGVMQQRVGLDGSDAYGWGSVSQAMDPVNAIAVFVDRAQGMEDSVSGDSATLAQAVQNSAFSDGSNYRSKEADARKLLELQDADRPSTEARASRVASRSKGACEDGSSGGGAGGSVGAHSVGVVSGEDDLPWRTEAYCSVSSCPPSAASRTGAYKRECTDWALWKLNEMAGVRSEPWKIHNTCPECPTGRMNDAAYWEEGWRAKGWPVSSKPAEGAVAWYRSNPGNADPSNPAGAQGHVGIVAEVLPGDRVLIREYNFLPGADHSYNERIAPNSEVSAFLLLPEGWTEDQ